MRIRKRKVPFSLSSLSPVPLSDLRLTTTTSSSSSIDHLQLLPQQEDKPSIFASSLPSIAGGDSSDYDGRSKQDEIRKVLLQEGDEDQKGGEGEKSNDTRRGSFFMGAKTPTAVFQESTTTFHQVDGKYLCEGKKSFPFKERRGRVQKSTSNEEESDVVEEKVKKMKAKTKMKMNKKSMKQNGNEKVVRLEDEDDGDNGLDIKETKQGGGYRNGKSSSTKRRASGGALMEGSRCSRVNGRGWRCCQQTLVGYSLCEHHLGKGRLRSMNSVRSRSSMATSTAPKKDEERSKPYSVDEKSACDPYVKKEEEEEKRPLSNIGKRKQKLMGTLKARTMSSLLGQTDAETDEVGEKDRRVDC